MEWRDTMERGESKSKKKAKEAKVYSKQDMEREQGSCVIAFISGEQNIFLSKGEAKEKTFVLGLNGFIHRGSKQTKMESMQ
jgi:hypothetical protein